MPGPGQGQAGMPAALASLQKQIDRLARRQMPVGGASPVQILHEMDTGLPDASAFGGSSGAWTFGYTALTLVDTFAQVGSGITYDPSLNRFTFDVAMIGNLWIQAKIGDLDDTTEVACKFFNTFEYPGWYQRATLGGDGFVNAPFGFTTPSMLWAAGTVVGVSITARQTIEPVMNYMSFGFGGFTA